MYKNIIVAKKISALLFLTLTIFLITACGSNKKQIGSPIVIYTAAEDERIAYLQEKLNNKFPKEKIFIHSLGTGAFLSKLMTEAEMTDCDIFYDLDSNNAEIILSKNPNLFADLSTYNFDIYDILVTSYLKRHKKYAVNGKTCGAFIVNKKLLKDKNLGIPKSYEDLLDGKYQGLVSVPSPNSSGTGYSFLNGMVAKFGKEKADRYFKSLNNNIKEYTTSGSAPVKAVQRGDVAIGFGMLWQCVQYSNMDSNLEVVIPDGEVPYSLFVMGMINGKDKDTRVKAIFNYLYYELNEQECAKYNPDKIYVVALKNEIPNYPTDFKEIIMDTVFDYEHKQELLDEWEY